MKYKVKKGDSLISISRKLGVSPDILLSLNPNITNPKMIIEGQILDLDDSDSYHGDEIEPIKITSENPSFSRMSSSYKTKISAYAKALKRGEIDINNIPKSIQSHIIEAAGSNRDGYSGLSDAMLTAPLAALAPTAYISGTAAKKGLAYISDKVSGRNEYGLEDLIGNTPISGRQYQYLEPTKSAITDLAVGFIPGLSSSAISSLSAGVRNLRSMSVNNNIMTGIKNLKNPNLTLNSIPRKIVIRGSGSKGGVSIHNDLKPGIVKSNTRIGYRDASKGTHKYSSSPSQNKISYTQNINMNPQSGITYKSWTAPTRGEAIRNDRVYTDYPFISEEWTENPWLKKDYKGPLADYKPGSDVVVRGSFPMNNDNNIRFIKKEAGSTPHKITIDKSRIKMPEGGRSKYYSRYGEDKTGIPYTK